MALINHRLDISFTASPFGLDDIMDFKVDNIYLVGVNLLFSYLSIAYSNPIWESVLALGTELNSAPS